MGHFDYPAVDFESHPSRYRHWDLSIDGAVATLTMHIKDDGPLWDGRYELKLNSYDLGVDVELTEVVDENRHALVGDRQEMVEEGGLARAEIAAHDGDGDRRR